MMHSLPKRKPNSLPRPHGLSKTHVIKLGGLDLIPDLSGALYVPDYQTLLIADLHLEQGASLARRGVHVPPYDSRQSLAQLAAVVNAINPERLIFLGDSFHDHASEHFIGDEDRSALMRITDSRNTIWLTGNHDPCGPQSLAGESADIVMLGPVALRHEPKLDLENTFEISGHLHPGATIWQRGRNIRTKCFIADEHRLIMPAFGSYTGAFGITHPAFDGLFDHTKTQVLMLGKTALHKFPRNKFR